MIYLDYNATTPLCTAAREAMLPYLTAHFGNPSSVHAAGREARAAIDDARDSLAALLKTKPHELIFTGSGTEANNLAIIGLARAHAKRGRHVICGATEHHAVLHAFVHLQKRENFEVTFLPVNSAGLTSPDDVEAAIRSDTTLVSIMSANNETGVIQPLGEISQICRERGVLLHSDMVQSFGKGGESGDSDRPFTSDNGFVRLVDAACFAAHKFHGPKGAGLLFLRAGVAIESIAFGGAHENQRRPGTENVAAIAGMAAAARWRLTDTPDEAQRQLGMREQLWCEISRMIPNSILNGETAPRLPNTLNIGFPGVSSETMLMALDLEGICASSGSACMVGSAVASHVLIAMGVSTELAASAIRFSLGKLTTTDEITRAAEAILRVHQRLSRNYAAA